MTDMPADKPSEDPAQRPPPEPTEEAVKDAEATQEDAELERAAPGAVSEDIGGGGAELGSLL